MGIQLELKVWAQEGKKAVCLGVGARVNHNAQNSSSKACCPAWKQSGEPAPARSGRAQWNHAGGRHGSKGMGSGVR